MAAPRGGKRLNAAFFQERHLLGVAQVGVGFVFDDACFPSRLCIVKAMELVGRRLSGLMGLSDDGRRGSTRQLTARRIGFRSAAETLTVELLCRASSTAVAELVVVLEQLIAYLLTQLLAISTSRASRSQPFASSSFFFFFSGNPFWRCVFLVLFFFVVSPFGQAFF